MPIFWATLYNIVLVVVQKIMNVTEKEAATALSTCLKNTKNRSSARKYMEKLRCANNVQEDAMEDTTEAAREDTTQSTGGGGQLDDEE